jgi:hypothetical protein
MRYLGKKECVMIKYKQRYETPKAWKDRKKDKLNQQKKGFKPAPYRNMSKGFQRMTIHLTHNKLKEGINQLIWDSKR